MFRSFKKIGGRHFPYFPPSNNTGLGHVLPVVSEGIAIQTDRRAHTNNRKFLKKSEFGTFTFTILKTITKTHNAIYWNILPDFR